MRYNAYCQYILYTAYLDDIDYDVNGCEESIPDQQDAWVKSQIDAGHYTNDSEFIRDLIRRDQERSAEIAAIRAALMAGEDDFGYLLSRSRGRSSSKALTAMTSRTSLD